MLQTKGGASTISSSAQSDEATIEFGYTVDNAIVSIVDIYGKLIEQHEITNQNTFVITNKNKASGVYFLNVEYEKMNTFIKLIIK